jgi:hypothetical protein
LCNKEIADNFNFDAYFSTTALSVLALHSSMIGESNSDPIERIFVLARPVKRSTYL